MSVPSNEQWKYRNSVPQINLLTPCQPPNLVQFSTDWNFYLSPQELVTPMSPEELAAYDKSLAPKLNQLRVDSSVQNFSQITVSRKTVATDDQNTEQIVGTGEDIPVVLQTQEDVSLAGPKWIKPPVNGVAQLSLNPSLAGLLQVTNFAAIIVQEPGGTATASLNNVPTTSNGNGTGATLNLTVTNGIVDSINVYSQGSGYQVGDSIFVSATVFTPPAPNNIELELIENSIAQILTNGGFGFPVGVTRGVKTQSVTGCGVQLTVTVDAPEGSVTSVVIGDEGKEYKVGDVIDIINPNEGQLSTVPNALFSSIIVPWNGIGTFGAIIQNVPLLGGSGTGATANFSINLSGVLTSITVTNPGSGYKIGDELQVLPDALGVGSTGPKFKLEFGDVASNATISVDILAPSPLATTQTDGFIQMDQGGFQLPTGPWGAQLGIVSLSYSGGSINGTLQNRLVVETYQPHGLNSCDKVTINGVDQFGSSNNFDVIAIHDANKFEINNPYEYGALPVGTALNALVVPHRQKSSIDQAGLSVPYRSAVSKTIQKQVFPTTELYACTEVGCNNQNYDFNNVGGQTGANGVPAQSIYSDPPPILQPQNFRGPVATSFGVSKQLNASELATLQLNSVPFPL